MVQPIDTTLTPISNLVGSSSTMVPIGPITSIVLEPNTASTVVAVDDLSSPVGAIQNIFFESAGSGSGSGGGGDEFTLSAGTNGAAIGYFFDLGPEGALSPDDQVFGETITAIYTDGGSNVFRFQLLSIASEDGTFDQINIEGIWTDGFQTRMFMQSTATYSNPGTQTRWQWEFGEEMIDGNTYEITVIPAS